MRNPEQTVGNMADKLKTAFIGSVDEQGFPNVQGYAPASEKRRHKSILLHNQHILDACASISFRQQSLCIFL